MTEYTPLDDLIETAPAKGRWLLPEGTDEMKTLFEEADAIVNGARQDAYGPPESSLADIASMWTVLAGTPISARQVALMMAALKLCRDKHSPKRDNLVDACGYLRLVELMEQPQPMQGIHGYVMNGDAGGRFHPFEPPMPPPTVYRPCRACNNPSLFAFGADALCPLCRSA